MFVEKWISSTSIETEQELLQFLSYLNYELETISNDLGRLQYRRYVNREPEPRIAELESQKSMILQHSELEKILTHWVGKVDDPRLKRQVECFLESSTLQKVEGHPEVLALYNELSDEIMAFRYKLSDNPEGSIGDVRHVLRTENDRSLRQQAWESVEPLAKRLHPKMMEFVHLRNKLSREAGFKSFVDLGLENQGTGLVHCKELLEQLNTDTHVEYMEILNERAARFGLASVEPWDLQFLIDGGIDIPEEFFPKKLLNQRLQEVSQLHGFPMDKLAIRPEYFDIPWNGVCMRVNHRKDARIISNPKDGYTYYHTMFHELGHALHAVLNTQPEFIFLREPSPSLEGVAETFGYLTFYADWLRDVGIPEAKIKTTVRAVLAPWFFYLRQRTALALFGFEIYTNPEQDLDVRLGQIEAEVTGVTANSMPRFAGNAWYVHGLSWHNYIVADMVASQLHTEMRQRFGSVYGNKEAFAFIANDYIAPGHMVPWRQKLASISGSDLGVRALVSDIKRMARGEGL